MSAVAQDDRGLTGGTAIWLFMALEVVTFGMFLVHHAASWAGQEQIYLASQAALHVDSATFGTILLLVGSWAAYRGVLSAEAGRPRPSAIWFAFTALSGLAFSINKIAEYSDLPEGVRLSTNGFWFSYLFLTGMHLLHVLVGVGGFAWLSVRAHRGHIGAGEDLLALQAGAAYWHLIDVIWLMLFPILYVMHP